MQDLDLLSSSFFLYFYFLLFLFLFHSLFFNQSLEKALSLGRALSFQAFSVSGTKEEIISLQSLVLKSAQGKEYGCLIIFYKEQRIIVLYKLERKLSQVSSLLLSLSLSFSPSLSLSLSLSLTSFIYTERSHHFFSCTSFLSASGKSIFIFTSFFNVEFQLIFT